MKGGGARVSSSRPGRVGKPVPTRGRGASPRGSSLKVLHAGWGHPSEVKRASPPGDDLLSSGPTGGLGREGVRPGSTKSTKPSRRVENNLGGAIATKASDDPGHNETTIEGGPKPGKAKEGLHLAGLPARTSTAAQVSVSLFLSDPLLERPIPIIADAGLKGRGVSKVHIVPTHTKMLSSNGRARDESAGEPSIFGPHSPRDRGEGHAFRISDVAMERDVFVPGDASSLTKDGLVQHPPSNCRQGIQTCSLDEGIVNGSKARKLEDKLRDRPRVWMH